MEVQSQELSKNSANTQGIINQQNLPNVREQFQFCIIFKKKLNEQEKEKIGESLKKSKFDVKFSQSIDNKKDVVFIGLNDPDLYFQQAYNLNLQKLSIQSTDSKQQFQNKIKSFMGNNQIASLDKLDKRIRLYENFQYVTLKTKDKLMSTYPEQYKTPDDLIGYFTPAEQVRLVYSAIQKVRIEEKSLLQYLKKEKMVQQISPLHIDEMKIGMNIPQIEQYFGEDISIYYRYLEFYQIWLIIPAILGLLCFLYDKYMKSDVYKISQAAYLYSFAILIWFTLMIIFWKRKESEINVRQRTMGSNIELTDKNPNFQGKEKINLVTGMPELQYSKIKRLFYYFLSFIESIPLLLLTTAVKIIILNLNGSIQDSSSIFYIESLQTLTREGSFLIKIPQYKRILNLITVLAIMQISKLYIIVSKNSTDKENHKTNNNYKNSLIFKRFFFELINRFLHYFYVAFAIHDLKLLKDMLLQLFLIDEFRKVFSESIMPILRRKFNEKRASKYSEINTKKYELNQKTQDKLMELAQPEYDNFGDYVEVIFQMFYCTAFASVFPLSATLSCIFNVVEMYSDKFKIVNKLYMRNIPMKVQGIGMWLVVMNLTSLFSVYSNITFLAFNSFNYFHNESIKHQHNEGPEWPWDIVFILEHSAIIFLIILRRLIPSKPKWVRIYKKRTKSNKLN